VASPPAVVMTSATVMTPAMSFAAIS